MHLEFFFNKLLLPIKKEKKKLYNSTVLRNELIPNSYINNQYKEEGLF